MPPYNYAVKYAVDLNVQIPVFRKETARLLSEEARRQGKIQNVHIKKIETGLHRIGVEIGEKLYELIDYIEGLGNINIDGIYSHFSNAYVRDDEYTIMQYERYKKAVYQLEKRGIYPQYKHICCSGASVWLNDTVSTHDRIGCMLIGFSPMEDGSNPYGVRHASSWRGYVTNICYLEKGDRIGYTLAEGPTKIATVSVGFCDGFFKPLTDVKAPVLINGKRGRYLSACMDQMLIDVTGIDCQINDEVTFFGYDRKTGECLTTDEISAITGYGNTLFHGYLNDRVKRIYINR